MHIQMRMRVEKKKKKRETGIQVQESIRVELAGKNSHKHTVRTGSAIEKEKQSRMSTNKC